MDQPKRKQIRLPSFDYSTPAAYFITFCTRNKRCVLSSVSAAVSVFDSPQLKLTATGKIVEKYILSMSKVPGVQVEKYVIMPNHVHLLLVITKENASARPTSPANYIIPRAISALKRFINKDAGGEIWQRSYYEHIVRNERDYREIWQYIEDNPAKWAEDSFYP